MPGALVYTDADLNVVFCNARFKEMYPAPSELLEPGRPYPEFLRFLAENGYYGEGDRAALVAKRVESLRNPSGASFEDRAPDGHFYSIRRRKVDGGGVVTVMTDITDQKEVERDLLEAKRTADEANGLRDRKERDARGAVVETVEVPLTAGLPLDLQWPAECRDRLEAQEAHGVLLRRCGLHRDNGKPGIRGANRGSQSLPHRDVGHSA